MRDTLFSDPHSFSNPHVACVTHLSWRANVDVDKHSIHAIAEWRITATKKSKNIVLDCKEIIIEKVLCNNKPTTYSLSANHPVLGQSLTIPITPDSSTITIYYQTSPKAEALQWLTPAQTSTKKFPFLFTQSQAILARSWIPCQDSPSIRFTYDAEVQVPPELIALMSASNPQTKNKTGVYHFEMKQPITSYLLALAVGDVEFKPISARSGIYAEPSVIDAAVWEFDDLEKMIDAAESLYGTYQWERYDVLVLPPSFPFGGMENPRLTFATPTILAGDRSLTSLIAHELAHSWSGNLVTNATWNDFWLNEGFTVYFEHRIMEKLYGKDYSEMLDVLASQDLLETIAALKEDNLIADTKLKLNLAGRNPDDGVTDIAYNKGYFFLRSIEGICGRKKFDSFLQHYFADNAFTSINTDFFIRYTKTFFQKKFSLSLLDDHFNSWIFTENLPPDFTPPTSSRFTLVETELKNWVQSGEVNVALAQHWSTHEWLHFLKNLPTPLSTVQLENLDAIGNFTSSGNAEILTAWGVLAIRYQYQKAFSKLEEFLLHTGRRKFLLPLYKEFLKTAEGKKAGLDIYKKARPNYHFVATQTFDKMFSVLQ